MVRRNRPRRQWPKFDRTRKRDGPLFRNRFKSRWIDSIRYRRTVLGYIHDNAVHAGVVSQRSDYRWCSAHDWKDGDPPRWLAGDWVREEVGARGRGATWDERMETAFPGSITEEHRQWVERQLRSRHADETEDESLKHAASPRVVRWTIRKAQLADGTRPWRPVCSVRVVKDVLNRARHLPRRLRSLVPGRLSRSISVLVAGLLRMLSGCTHREIALHTGRHRGTVAHDVHDHRERIENHPAYANLVSTLARSALAAVGV